MKTLIISLITTLLLGIATSLSAQKDDKKPALITFTAGWCNSTFTGDNTNSLENRNGFFGGIRKDFKLIPLLRLNTGVLFTQQGAGFKDGEIADYELSYIDVPVGLKFKLGPAFITGGLSANFKINEDLGDIPENADPEIKPFDLVYSVGLGVKILMVSLDLRWNNSFIDITKAEGEAKNSYFLIGLGFSIQRD